MTENVSLDRSTPQGKQNYDILKKTLIGEAASESEEGQRAICWVIYNRVRGNKTYWYDAFEGNNIVGVCLAKYQFECWNPGEKSDDLIKNSKTSWAKKKMAEIDEWLPRVFEEQNPIGECDHYKNSDKEEDWKELSWKNNVDFVKTIGKHHFYRTKPKYR